MFFTPKKLYLATPIGAPCPSSQSPRRRRWHRASACWSNRYVYIYIYLLSCRLPPREGRILKFQMFFKKTCLMESQHWATPRLLKKAKNSFRFNSQLGPSHNCGCCVSCKKRLRVNRWFSHQLPSHQLTQPRDPKHSLLNPCLGGAKLVYCRAKQKDLPIYPMKVNSSIFNSTEQHGSSCYQDGWISQCHLLPERYQCMVGN